MADVVGSWRAGKPQGPLTVFGLAIVIATVAIDQIAKLVAVAQLPIGSAVELLPILTLYRVENTGIAFSFLSGGGLPLVIMTLIVATVVVGFWVRAGDGGRLAAAGFALIVGGAIGNLIDRIRLGSVVDFLLLHFGERTLFVFNLADAALTLGPALLIVTYLFPSKE
ncbi:MAG TPA: signal peptidase II [Bauldia sp.]|nr:signal peptidase II [Bauldia sp.]